jgi:epoxyqueuosine reductase
VCPWNERFSAPASESAYAPRTELDNPALIDLAARLLEMSGKGFQREFRDSPVSRARRNGLLRNVCVALGNWGAAEAVPILERAARDHSELVREHARWALDRVAAGAPDASAE